MAEPVYSPRILRGLNEICVFMGVGRETVRRWHEQGAPIVLEKSGRRAVWLAELAALWQWRREKEDGNGEI